MRRGLDVHPGLNPRRPPSRATMICASRAREAGASCAVRGASEVKRPNGALISAFKSG